MLYQPRRAGALLGGRECVAERAHHIAPRIEELPTHFRKELLPSPEIGEGNDTHFKVLPRTLRRKYLREGAPHRTNGCIPDLMG